MPPQRKGFELCKNSGVASRCLYIVFENRMFGHKYRGSEKTGPERGFCAQSWPAPVPRQIRKGPHNRGIGSATGPWRNRLGLRAGGGRGIRTLDTVSRIHAFQACAFSHSATPPISSMAHALLHEDARKARF